MAKFKARGSDVSPYLRRRTGRLIRSVPEFTVAGVVPEKALAADGGDSATSNARHL
jgi:hypothetical protein